MENKQLQQIQATLDQVVEDIKILKSALIPKVDKREEYELIRAAKHELSNVKNITTALLQRRLQLGYLKTAALLDKLEELGVVSKKNKEGNRKFIELKNRNKK